MKVNSVMVVMSIAIVGSASGCCWLKCESCEKDGEKCCEKQCGIGMHANVGSASADAGMSMHGFKKMEMMRK